MPVLGKPDDLRTFDETETAKAGCNYGRQTAEGPCAYPTRKEIEQGCLAGRNLEICWLSDWVDGFFMHVQGSGRVQLDDGTTMRLSYAAKSGQPYVAIGGVLVQRGVLTRDTMSMQSLKAWMKSNPNEARELMWQNPSYIFFRETGAAPENRGSIGAGKVHLTPHRSIAIDASHYLYGTPLWLETATPAESPGSAQPFHHLMIAQDTGSAIQGLVRGDVYWGWGEEAAIIAGHMKSSGKMTALLPRAVVERLGLMT